MTTRTAWRDFLVEHAKFPFPPVGTHSITDSATDISEIQAGLLEREWKAKYAIRDETLFQKLCNALESVLGDTVVPGDDHEGLLLSNFGRSLQFSSYGEKEYEHQEWSTLNNSKGQTRMLLNRGFFEALSICLAIYGKYSFDCQLETYVDGGSSKLDYLVMVNDHHCVLGEAESPKVMKSIGDLLPARGIELKWVRGQSLPKIFQKTALHLGLKKMEWLFITCHNYWIVCRLVRDDVNPFLAYSPIYSIENSSVPFRAFLGAVLSVLKAAPVQPSIFNPDMELDCIHEEGDDGSLPEGDFSGAYQGNSSTTIPLKAPMTCGSVITSCEASEIRITSSSPNSPESFQTWVHLRPLPDNTFLPPQCIQNWNSKQRLWLTRFIRFGSTGSVWQCHFDNSDSSFAIKVVELLHRPEAGRRQSERFYNELRFYRTLEKAYKSGKLHDRITPHCYGAFEGDGIYVLILELLDENLKAWGKLDDSERVQVYELVYNLHRAGIVHNDLEYWNMARAPGGGFRLIDFTESGKHKCKEVLNESDEPISTRVIKCYELRTMRDMLWKHQPLEGHPGNL